MFITCSIKCADTSKFYSGSNHCCYLLCETNITYDENQDEIRHQFFHKYTFTTVALVEAEISFINNSKQPDFMTKLNFSFNLFTVFSLVTVYRSTRRFPLSVYHFGSRGLCSVRKDERSHTGYQAAKYHASSHAGK